MSGYSECGRKKVYYTKSQAKKDRDRIRKNYHTFDIFIYKCKYCGYFHVSSQEKRKKRYVIKSENIVFYR